MKRIIYNILVSVLLLSFMAACTPAATPTDVITETEEAPATEEVVDTEEVTEAPATEEIPTETTAPEISGPQGILRVALPTEPSSLYIRPDRFKRFKRFTGFSSFVNTIYSNLRGASL